jgi:hypothetical protein
MKKRAKVQATVEAVVSFDADNYGDNPYEYFVDNMALDSLWLFGDEWTERELRLTFGDMGAEALLQLIFNNVEDWENE